MLKLGQYVKGNGEIPAGGDANIVHPVFTSGTKPVMLVMGSYWGGDAAETIAFGIIPTTVKIAALREWEYYNDGGNGIAILTGATQGGLASNDAASLFANHTRTPQSQLIIPPNSMVVAWANNANAAAWYSNFAGFECEY
jgi:hypothetical protein